MSGFGGMLAIAFKGGATAARKFAESTHLFQLAESRGGVESLVNYPSETDACARGTALDRALPKNKSVAAFRRSMTFLPFRFASRSGSMVA